MDIGTIAHRVLLEGHERGIAVIDANDWRTKAAKEARDAARAAGLTPILAGKIARVREMVAVAHEFIATCELSDQWDGPVEQTVLWQDGGLWCRALVDKLTPYTIWDYKTTDCAEPEHFIRTRLTGMGYDVQAAFYLRGLEAVGAINSAACNWAWLVQEVEPPYACSLVGMSSAAEEHAQAKVAHGIKLWGDCMQSGKWPAYGPRIAWADPVPWDVARWHERKGMQELGSELDGLDYERLRD